MLYAFVGERPSPTAALFDALCATGVEPAACRFVNLWDTPGLGCPHAAPALAAVWDRAAAGYTVVALGRLVARVLTEAGIPHLALRHPAARGAGRARDHYRAHVRSVLQGDSYVHPYHYPGYHGRPTCCRMETWEDGKPPVLLLTELPEHRVT